MNKKRTSIIWQESKTEFQERVNKCASIADILRSYGFAIGSANYKTVHTRIKEEQIDISHIVLGVGSKKGMPCFNQRKPLDEFLIEGSNIKTHSLKQRLIRDGWMVNKCVECGLEGEWNGKAISLQLDHINGVRNDNRIENLRILCPNCHSQTPTYCGKHKKIKSVCLLCDKLINKKSTYCHSCASKQMYHPKKFDISKEELEKLVWEKSTSQIAREFDVSDKAIEKRCKKFGIEKPPRGYWMKNKPQNSEI